MRSIIIGIDAGATFAFAALNFNGEVLAVRSKRNCKREDIIRMLEPFEPVIIGCDTNPPSKLGKYLSATFGCRLSYPPKSLTEIEKNRMTADFNYKNTHEKDALAAGLKAYFKIANKMRQVGRHLRNKKSPGDLQAAKQMVASGRRISDL